MRGRYGRKIEKVLLLKQRIVYMVDCAAEKNKYFNYQSEYSGSGKVLFGL